MKRRLRKLLVFRSSMMIALLVMLTGYYQNSLEARPKLRRISNTPINAVHDARPSPAQKFEALKLPEPQIQEGVKNTAPTSDEEIAVDQSVSENFDSAALIAMAEKQVAQSNIAMASLKDGSKKHDVPPELAAKISELPMSAQYLIHLATLLPDREIQASN